MSQKQSIDVTFTTPAIGARQPKKWTKKKSIGLALVVMLCCFAAGVGTGMFNHPVASSGIDRYKIGLADGQANANRLQTAAYEAGYKAALEENKKATKASYEAGYAEAQKHHENLSWDEKLGITWWPKKWPWE